MHVQPSSAKRTEARAQPAGRVLGEPGGDVEMATLGLIEQLQGAH